ncbi:Hypothetical predicted protein [Octopus vulgaris]|uniref:Uncharacterized protein n=1 Tax=Octopus vulgaris TaxID=6645 RepID=A0AA36B3R8_OCTVU|nr:Hypothetical predicted protein [Octopus vulgaris]
MLAESCRLIRGILYFSYNDSGSCLSQNKAKPVSIHPLLDVVSVTSLQAPIAYNKHHMCMLSRPLLPPHCFFHSLSLYLSLSLSYALLIFFIASFTFPRFNIYFLSPFSLSQSFLFIFYQLYPYLPFSLSLSLPHTLVFCLLSVLPCFSRFSFYFLSFIYSFSRIYLLFRKLLHYFFSYFNFSPLYLFRFLLLIKKTKSHIFQLSFFLLSFHLSFSYPLSIS